MKTLLLLVLAVLGANAAVVKAPAARANLSVGYVATGDRLLLRSYVYRGAIGNTIQYEDLVYRGNRTNWVTAVQATEVGGTQYASAWIISGGIGQNNVTVRFQSSRGRGYYYLISVWGR